ncbi:putative oxidoreductase [Aspergillus flavus AF70]|nr:putative oxidoreductase [Aspergillus flavus AF70]
MPPRLQILPTQWQRPLSRPLSAISSLSLLFPQIQQQSRNAHILASLSDTPGAYNKRIRRGRGPASGKGKTSGRGHKGQKQHGKVPARFNGGQTPEIIVHGERGFNNVFSLDLAPVNLDRIQEWIDQGRIDPARPITIRELAQSRCIHQTKEGVKLLGRGAESTLKQPIHIVVSRASATAIAAVEAAGGSVTTRFYTKSAIARIMRREMHPFVSTAWTKESGSEGLNNAEGAENLTESAIMKEMGFQYRLPDPTKRKDIEYYRDPAHRGYLSHLLKPMEGPSLFFRSPVERKTAAGVKKEKVLPENRLWLTGNLNYHVGREDPNGPHHALVGVASSRSRDVAKEFLESFDVPECTLTFHDYSELVRSDLIDVVFIATPHSHHFQNALLALEAGNHVVCQKSLTVNAAQAKKLFETAKREQLFLMEGWWLWWPQASRQTCRLLRDGEIGQVNRIVANFGIRNNYCMFGSASDRLTSKELAGGALLELGSLALHWILRALPGGACRPTQVTSTMKKCPESGVDETTTIDMGFSIGGRDIRTKAIASLSTPASPDGQLAHVIIEGSNGKIEIRGWEAIPTELYLFKNSYSLSKPYDVTFHEEEPLFVPEADEVARCIREGLLESPEMPWAESLLVMEIMDFVRKQNDLQYPPEIEASEPSVMLPSRLL